MAWDTPLNLLREEIVAREEEGCVVPAALRARIDALDAERDAYAPAVAALDEELAALPWDEELAAREPNELAAIRALRPDGPRDLGWRPSEAEALDRFHGAWTGRATGCALGKPVELIGLRRDAAGRAVGREAVRRYLEARREWPLVDYFSGASAVDDLSLWCPRSQREQIAFMEPDDDIHYSLVALGVMEAHGPLFDWQDVARYWLGHLPIFTICTAEAQAIETVQRWSTRPGYWRCEVGPEVTRRRHNPYRQWIGAQIRADGWGWMAAGRPELAAEWAYRDACWTHERNGIYGEMMFAAMAAAAFVERDPRALVAVGLSEIPRDCRLARAVREALGWFDQDPSFEACMDRVDDTLGGLHPVHTVNNAVVCVLALMCSAMDPFAATTSAVMAGYDTDCNGATVGALVGAASGRSGFETRLSPRLNDRIKPDMAGFEAVTMHELAARTLAQFRRALAGSGR